MCEIQGTWGNWFLEDAQRLASYECVTVLEISLPGVEAARCIPTRCVPGRCWHFAILWTVASRNDASPLLPFLLLQGNNYYIIMATVALPAGHVGKEWNWQPLFNRQWRFLVFFFCESAFLMLKCTLGCRYVFGFVCFNAPSEVPLYYFFYNFTPAEPVYPLAVKCSFAVFKETSQAGE